MGPSQNICHLYRQSLTKREGRGSAERAAGITAANFPNLCRHVSLQDQEDEQMRKRISLKRPLPKHITIRLFKTKNLEEILKAIREKQYFTHRGKSMKMTEAILIIQIQDVEKSSLKKLAGSLI